MARCRHFSVSSACLSSAFSSSAIRETLLCLRFLDVIVLRSLVAVFLSELATKWKIFFCIFGKDAEGGDLLPSFAGGVVVGGELADAMLD